MEANITPKVSKSNVSLVIAFIAIGFAEKHDLKALFWVSIIFGTAAAAIQIAVLIKYVIDYYKGKDKE